MDDLASSPRSRSRSISASEYRTRFLSALALALLLVTGALNVPWYPADTGRVGWGASKAEPIQLMELSQQDDPDAPARGGSMPLIAQAPPVVSKQPVAEKAQESASDARHDTFDGDGDEDTISDESRAVSMKTLRTAGAQPEIVGGMGALYLQIDYPLEARRRGIQGSLKLNFTVYPDGMARDIRVSRSLHPLCDSAAVDGLRSVRFAAGRKDGLKVPVRMTLPVRFKLQPSPAAAAQSTRDRSSSDNTNPDTPKSTDDETSGHSGF